MTPGTFHKQAFHFVTGQALFQYSSRHKIRDLLVKDVGTSGMFQQLAWLAVNGTHAELDQHAVLYCSAELEEADRIFERKDTLGKAEFTEDGYAVTK